MAGRPRGEELATKNDDAKRQGGRTSGVCESRVSSVKIAITLLAAPKCRHCGRETRNDAAGAKSSP